jgi:hypothetical protein
MTVKRRRIVIMKKSLKQLIRQPSYKRTKQEIRLKRQKVKAAVDFINSINNVIVLTILIM